MPPDLALSPTLIGSNYPCLELISMVPKVVEPLKFDCTYHFLLRALAIPELSLLLSQTEKLNLRKVD